MTPEQVALEEAARASITADQNLNLGTFTISSANDALLCGVMIIQMMEYWTYSRDDSKFVKSSVIITTLSSIGASIFIIVLMFKLFVYDFGKYAPFAALDELTYMCIFDIVPSTATQLFFTYRAYKLAGRSKILALTIISMILVSITGAIGFFITQQVFHKNHKTIIPSKSSFTYCWLIGALGADLLITCSIMWGLWKSKTGWKQTDRTITRLIRVMIETQIPPTLLLIVFFIFAYAYPSTYLDVYPLWLQSKFYTCGLLASLNSRYSLRRAIANGSSSGRTTSKPPVVHVLTETYVQSDDHQGLPHKDQPKPRYLSQHDNLSTRKPVQDPLDFDEISLELDHTPKLDGITPDTEGDMNSSHKLDYVNNESRTGLTDERK